MTAPRSPAHNERLRVRPRSLEAILSLPEEDIRASFPYGVVPAAGGRFIPAPESTDHIGLRTVKDLLRQKKCRMESTPRLMRGRPGSHDPLKADIAGTEEGPYEGDYTDSPYLAMALEPECVDESTQESFTKESRRRFDSQHQDELAERQAKVIANKVVSIQREGARFGLDFAPRLAAFVKEANAEIAAKRRQAA